MPNNPINSKTDEDVVHDATPTFTNKDLVNLPASMTKPISARVNLSSETEGAKEWENQLRIGLDDIFEDDQSYTGPNADHLFDVTLEWTKAFISETLAKERAEILEWAEEHLGSNWDYSEGKTYPSDVLETCRDDLKLFLQKRNEE